jgi:hypothetical protein
MAKNHMILAAMVGATKRTVPPTGEDAGFGNEDASCASFGSPAVDTLASRTKTGPPKRTKKKRCPRTGARPWPLAGPGREARRLSAPRASSLARSSRGRGPP